MSRLTVRTGFAALVLSTAGCTDAGMDALRSPGIDWDLSAAAVRESCIAVTAMTRGRIQSIISAADYDRSHLGLLADVESALGDMHDSLAAQRFLADVAPDPEIRQASLECRTAVDRVTVHVASHPVIYRVAAATLSEASSPVDRKLAEIYVQSGRKAGAHLDTEARQEVTALLAELARLQADFLAALADGDGTIEISAAEAAALPASLTRTFGRARDSYLVPVADNAVGRAFLSSMASAPARRRYQIALLNRGGPANLERLQRALELRRRIAALSGYASWAHYQLESRMAKTPGKALALVREVNAALTDKARSEIATLAALKSADGDESAFAVWDYPYYRARLAQEELQVDEREVRRFFPMTHVLPRVLEIFEALFGVRMRLLPSGNDAWAPGVQLVSVTEAGRKQPRAFIYLDLVRRSGKAAGFANVPLRAAGRRPDGIRLPAVSSIVGNGPSGTEAEPALFSHRELMRFFHEFAHAMHAALARSTYPSIHGLNVRRDFLEIAALTLENLVWQPEVLRRLSRHVDTGESMPQEMIEKLIARRRLDAGVFWKRQAFLAAWELTLHAAGSATDANGLWIELADRMAPLPSPPDTIPAASFVPIMSGHDTAYYGSLWARVYAQDLFTVFEREGTIDPDVGMRFRRTILEPGGIREPEEMVFQFLGRPVAFDAFLKALGAG